MQRHFQVTGIMQPETLGTKYAVTGGIHLHILGIGLELA